MISNYWKKDQPTLWKPVTLDFLLEKYSLWNDRVFTVLVIWVLLIGVSLMLTIQLLPENWPSFASDGTDILHFFLFNPALIIGILLFFWVGFEWGFTPIFLSSFILAFHSGMPWIWAIVFGISFVLGLAISAMAYQGFQISYDLLNFKSIVFYIAIMFIGSIASSLGAFIWSFAHNLSAYKTLVIWKSWWSGSFLQAILIIAPLLFLFTPVVERLKNRWLDIPQRQEVSLKWVFGAVSSITAALALFIYSGRYLGKLRVEEVMANSDMTNVADVISALESFELISWISIGIIIVTGFGAFLIISGWNRQLNKEVDERTQELNESRTKLAESLDEKEILLKEIHHRVKNNLALMGALLELQERSASGENGSTTLSTARSRIKSMAMAHEALYQNETFSDISMKNYIERIANYTHSSFKNPGTDIKLQFDLDDTKLEMTESIPLGLIINEILINAFKHAFKGRKEGSIAIESTIDDENIELLISDDGVGLPENYKEKMGKSLGMTLIRKFSKQLKGELDISSGDSEGTTFTLQFET